MAQNTTKQKTARAKFNFLAPPAPPPHFLYSHCNRDKHKGEKGNLVLSLQKGACFCTVLCVCSVLSILWWKSNLVTVGYILCLCGLDVEYACWKYLGCTSAMKIINFCLHFLAHRTQCSDIITFSAGLNILL